MRWAVIAIVVVLVVMAGGMAGGQASGGQTGAAECVTRPAPATGGSVAILSPEQVASVAYRAGFRGEDLVTAVAVTAPESGRDPTNVGGPNDDGTFDYGLWQINSVHSDLLAAGDWRDPASNANMAYAVWRGGGWRAWTTFRLGEHLPFMAEARDAVAKLAAAGVPVGDTGTAGAQAACDVAAIANPDVPAADLSTLLAMPSVAMNSLQVADLRSGGIDPRVISVLIWIGEHHSIVVTALRRDHPPGTNHEAGRAVDIGVVDGFLCAPYGPTDPCGKLVYELATLTGPLKPTEEIAIFDPSPTDPANFAQADHWDHVHVGWDG